MPVKKLKKAIIGWKKAFVKKDHYNTEEKCIIQLIIPKGTRVFIDKYGGISAKCRAEKAFVLGIYSFNSYYGIKNNLKQNVAYSLDSSRLKYEIGKIVKSDSFDTHPYQCSNGIHFYKTLQGALNH